MRSLLLSALLFALTGCQAVVGNGQLTSSTREVTPFRTLSVSNSLNATLTRGARAVEVRADENLQPYIEAFVEGETLVLRARPGVSLSSRNPMQVTIANELLEAVNASGASNVTADLTPVETLRVGASGSSHVILAGVSSTRVEVDASGASDVTLTGSASDGRLSGSGSSNLLLGGLTLSTAEIHMSGSSNLRARISSSVTGDASGSSDVLITGTPTTSVALSGGSNLVTGAQ